MIYTIDQIRSITAPIAARYGIYSVSLFGSYARGEATDTSDVDLLIDRGDVISGFKLGGLYADLQESLGKDLDMVTRQAASPAFISRIHDDLIPLYSRATD